MKAFRNILYLADDAAHVDMFQRALQLARDHQARLTLLDVVPDPAISDAALAGITGKAALLERLVAARGTHWQNHLDTAEQAGDVQVKIVVGKRYLEAIRAVLQHGYDLVLKPADSPSWLSRFLTSDDMHLLRKCPCPVWLMQTGRHGPDKLVLAAIDVDPDASCPADDPLNKQILGCAAAVAAYESAEIRVVHAWESPVAEFATLFADDPDETERQIRDGELRARRAIMHDMELWLREGLGPQTCELLQPDFQIIRGRPEHCIPEYAAKINASVVVMGTVARFGIPGLFIGNTAEDILQQLRCDVVAIKPEHFESPVRINAGQ